MLVRGFTRRTTQQSTALGLGVGTQKSANLNDRCSQIELFEGLGDKLTQGGSAVFTARLIADHGDDDRAFGPDRDKGEHAALSFDELTGQVAIHSPNEEVLRRGAVYVPQFRRHVPMLEHDTGRSSESPKAISAIDVTARLGTNGISGNSSIISSGFSLADFKPIRIADLAPDKSVVSGSGSMLTRAMDTTFPPVSTVMSAVR